MKILEELDAEVAVRQVMVAYMAACDVHDPDAVAVLFTETARWQSMSSTDPPLIGREAIRSAYSVDCARLTFCVHYLTNERILIDGDRATARFSYFEPAVNRGTLAVWTAGRYQLELLREGSTWRFCDFSISSQLAAPYAGGWVPVRMVELR